MRMKNIAAGLGFLVFGAVYASLTAQLPLRTVGNVPGPSFFPWVLTWCFLGLSCVLLIQGLMAPAHTPSTPKQNSAPESQKRTLRRQAMGLILLAIYLALLPFLGFLLATPLFFGALMWTAGERRPIPILGWGVGIPLFLYLMFDRLFSVPIPATPGF